MLIELINSSRSYGLCAMADQEEIWGVVWWGGVSSRGIGKN
jgi:hypothetical protein